MTQEHEQFFIEEPEVVGIDQRLVTDLGDIGRKFGKLDPADLLVR